MIKWTTKNGDKIAIEDMSASHLLNCIKLCKKYIVSTNDTLCALQDEEMEDIEIAYGLGLDDCNRNGLLISKLARKYNYWKNILVALEKENKKRP